VSRLLLSAVVVALASSAPYGQAQPASAPAAQTQGVRAPAPAAAVPGRAVPAPPTSTLPKQRDSVKFLVIGDTGTGSRSQYDVGARIADAYKQFPFEFAIMLGDNLYGSENASAFVNKFERPYKPLLDAGVRFYASLGNHDEPSQRFYKPFNMDGKRYYTFRKGDVEFFVLDSTYMTPEQVKWLADELERSDAEWKIPYFHHPIYSSGEKHGSELDLQVLVEPLFVKHGVDVVFSGHEHFYERLKPQKGIHYFTQGGGAKLREGNIRTRSPLTARGFDSDNSFTLVEIVDDEMHFETISRRGQVVDSGSLTRREVTPVITSTQ
jgi:predicted phosphodiesterase